MKRTFGIVMGVMLLFFTASLWAQKSKKKTASAKTDKGKPVVYKAYRTPIPVYLGHTDINTGTITKPVFDSLMQQGLTGRDSSGVDYKVTGFDFTYGERNTYEDSTGSIMVLTDYMIEHCDGDTVSAVIAGSLYQRTKAGDTIFIDHVTVLRPDSVVGMGKSMKIVIGK